MVHIHNSGFFKVFHKNRWIPSYFLLEKCFGVQKNKSKKLGGSFMAVGCLMGISFCEKKSSMLVLGLVLDLNNITDGNFGVFPCGSGG